MYLAVTKETLLITVLLTGKGKSLVFIVLVILLGSEVIIIVILYTKLKRQLVTCYINTSLDYKP